MLFLKENPTIKDFQKYVNLLEEDRGFIEEGVIEKCLMLGEEVGELYKAVRKSKKLKIDNNSQVGTISEELADIIIFLCSIANRFDIDIEKAFREKEEINKNRTWK